jgi:hypothetical protein
MKLSSRNQMGAECVEAQPLEREGHMTWIALASLTVAAAVGFAVLATTLQHSEQQPDT